MCVYVHMCLCVSLHICMGIYHAYTCMHFCVCLHAYYIDNVSLFVCLHVCTYVLCMNMSMPVQCMHMWTVGQGRLYRRYLHYITHPHWSVLYYWAHEWDWPKMVHSIFMLNEVFFFLLKLKTIFFIQKTEKDGTLKIILIIWI